MKELLGDMSIRENKLETKMTIDIRCLNRVHF